MAKNARSFESMRSYCIIVHNVLKRVSERPWKLNLGKYVTAGGYRFVVKIPLLFFTRTKENKIRNLAFLQGKKR
jgi:hypothetical protein